MRILKQPKVYTLVKPQIDEEGLRAFLSDNDLTWPTPTEGVSDADRVVEVAGRCCYMSFGAKAGSKTNYGYIQNLMGRNLGGSFKPGPAHGSVTEHPCWSFIITGAGRGFSHEQVRHRVGWAYSQLSTRYCDFEREEETGTWDPGFVIPPLAQLDDQTATFMEESMDRARNDYTQALHMIEEDLSKHEGFQKNLAQYDERTRKRMLRKAARGAARDLLVIGTEAIMVMSANARALWNCMVLRGNEHAEAPIRSIYVQLAKIMEKQMPALFYGLKYYTIWDGSDAVEMPREKL